MRSSELSSPIACEVLDVVESFLFRRAIVGIEPTGLHSVFKGLWADLTTGDAPEGVSAASVRKAISERATVWPNNAAFEEGMREGNLYKRRAVKFALAEYEVACEGETPSDAFQIEHIVPQSDTSTWRTIVGERYEELVDTWANLSPLTGRMNKDAGQADYEVKRTEYEDSIFASTREVADKYAVWTPVDVEDRATAIVEWALGRWPVERVQ